MKRIESYFISSDIDPVTRTSKVTIKMNGKEYTAKSVCALEDNFSKFTGCRFAEIKARIKGMKDLYRKEKRNCEECRKFVNAVSQYAGFDPKSPEARMMFRQLNRRIKRVNDIATQINLEKFILKVGIQKQTRLNNKIKQDKLNTKEEN